jgi:hypothetical protein
LLLLIIASLCLFSSWVSLLEGNASFGVLIYDIMFGIFCACELAFCFSERPSVGTHYDIEINAYRKDEKHLLAESVERMYERECNVSTESDACLQLAFIYTETY